MKNFIVDSLFEDLYLEYPLILLDVGASGGISDRWKVMDRYLRAVCFEPDERSYAELKCKLGDKDRLINAALHSEDGAEIRFNLAKLPTNSSAFPPNMPFLRQFPDHERFEVVDSVEMKTKCLTIELLKSEGVDDADFIKVDTQGSELSIFQGAKELLDKYIFGIEVEVEFAPIYKGQPLFTEVDGYLRQMGYELFDLRRYYWKRAVDIPTDEPKGQLIFADALYFKSYTSFCESVRQSEQKRCQAKMLKAISICLIYGKYDYANYIFSRALNDHLFSPQEGDVIAKSLSIMGRKKRIKGSGRLAKIFHDAYRKLELNSFFYYVDEELGS